MRFKVLWVILLMCILALSLSEAKKSKGSKSKGTKSKSKGSHSHSKGSHSHSKGSHSKGTKTKGSKTKGTGSTGSEEGTFNNRIVYHYLLLIYDFCFLILKKWIDSCRYESYMATQHFGAIHHRTFYGYQYRYISWP